MKKVSDIVAKIGTYQKDGNDKARWQNVGCELIGDDGKRIMLIERSLNLAGLPFKDGESSVVLYFFDPKGSSQPAQAKQVEEEIPF